MHSVAKDSSSYTDTFGYDFLQAANWKYIFRCHSDTWAIQSNSCMHHYKCIALYKAISLQRDQFWAAASCSPRHCCRQDFFLKNSRPTPRPWYQVSRPRGRDPGTSTTVYIKQSEKTQTSSKPIIINNCIIVQTVVHVHTPTTVDMVLGHFLCNLRFLCTLTMQITIIDR